MQAIVTRAGTTPIFGEFETPAAQNGLELISVTAAALSNLTRGRAAGPITAPTICILSSPAWTA